MPNTVHVVDIKALDVKKSKKL